jgi:SAM-dependent methyltransferase
MKTEYAPEFLRCPTCRSDRSLRLASAYADDREVREGTLVCSVCAAERLVRRGVGHLMVDPPEHVKREAAGLERFALVMYQEGWTPDRIRQLPDIESGYWHVQAVSMTQLLAEVDFQPGQSLLDVGSNTCWASNRLAREGLAVTALDISLTELQGLFTSDYFIEPGISYFERVLGSMNDMPIASESLDYVFCCEVLHHNDPGGLGRTIQEAHRVLKPGGRLLILNETLKTLRDPHGVHIDTVLQYEGYEHAHWAARYRWEAIRAGFRTRLLEPAYHEFFGRGMPQEPRPRKKDVRPRLLYEARSHEISRRAYLAWLLHVNGGISLGMVATKPPRRASDRPLRQRSSATRGAVRLKT